MAKLLNVSSSPHVRNSLTTHKIMYLVILSLMPVSILGIVNYGMGALSVILAAVIAAVVAEAAFNAIIKKPQTIADGSAALTGLLLALVLPPNLPIYIPVLGSVFAIVVVKGLFGGLGKNFLNPALAARCFLLISYGSRLTTYKIDGVTTATPLVNIAAGQPVDLLELFIGHTSGIIGSSVLGILIGAVILFAFKIISYEIPLATIGSFTIFIALFGAQGTSPYELLVHVMGGGVLFGAIFMATDYVTSPVTPAGQWVFGIVIGVLCGLFRVCGSAPDSASYGIIFANILVPLIEDYTVPVAYGHRVKKEKTGFKVPKPAVTLCVITLVAGAALSGVYALTKDTIAAQKLAKEQASYKAVCAEAAEFVNDEAIDAKVAELGGEIYGTDFGKSYINKVLVGKNAAGDVVGYVISATSGDGFDGNIVMSIGLDASGVVTGIEFTTITETAGMGMLVTEAAFKDQYIGDDVEKFEINKVGGSTEPYQIDGVAGATISSKAVNNAVNAARDFFAVNMK